MSNDYISSLLRFAIPPAIRKKLSPADKDSDLITSSIPGLFSGVAVPSLTPDKLVSVVTEADAGDPRQQAALFSTVQEKESIIAACLQTRRLAVLSCKWSVRSEKHPKEAEEMSKMLECAGLRHAMAHLLDAIGTGYSGVVVDWLPGAKGIKGFVPIMPDVWTFDEGGNPAINPPTGLEMPLNSWHPAQIVYIQAEAKVGLPCRKGLMRTLLWLYCFKNSAFRDWAVFLERFGMPFILGRVSSGDFRDKAKREDLLRSIMSIRSGGAGIGTTDTDMQMINGAASGNQQAYEQYQRYCDELITLSILGQLASSDHSGGLSKGTAQEQVRQDILTSDCLMLSERINAVIIRWLAELTYGLDPDDFRFSIDCEKPEDMNVTAERDAKIAAAAGCKLSRKYAMEKYGLELEEPERQQANAGEFNSGRVTQFSDMQVDMAEVITKAALSRMVETDAFAAWRIPVNNAIRSAFGDLDPDSETLVEDFRKRAPAFLASLPGLMDEFTPEQFADAIQESMLAAFLNGTLPPEFWKKKKMVDNSVVIK